VTADEVEFLRWRAERWMKARHFWPALTHNPAFVLRHGVEMFRHTFRGSSLKWLVGLEGDREVFARYQAIRRAEREYLPTVPDTLGVPGAPSPARI
jgi:anaerobic magnesium-protoporphyrin IX monomethyl ester cyclase